MEVRRPLLLCLLVVLAAAPVAEAARQVPRGFHGVMFDGVAGDFEGQAQADQFALMARTGVESARTVFSWNQAQPSADAPPSFGRTDELVANAAAHRVDLLPIVMYAPPWARRNGAIDTSPPARAGDYAAFLEQLVSRYGPRGSFWAERPDLPRRPLRRWQVWNEPHLGYQWTVGRGEPGAFPRGYVELLRAARQALRRADPGARLVLAGLTNDSWNHLRALYRGGARGLFDAVAVQTYTATARRVLAALRRVRGVMAAAGEGRKQVLLTEISWPAARGRTPVPRYHRRIVTTDAGMAARLTAAYTLAARHRRAMRLGGVYWYTWASSYRRGSIFNFAGLGSSDGAGFARKPAWRAYLRVARRQQGCAKDSSGSCR